ncbi:MAG: Clp protease ClpP [Actinomycetota bacterium]|nr:Clp protease ClpP [Actinomycetota bacterium]
MPGWRSEHEASNAAPEAVTIPRQRPGEAPDGIEELVTLTDPDDVLPPLGPVPVDAAGQREWLESYRERLLLRRAAAELRKWTADAARSEIELAEATRRDADARAEASRQLTYTFYADVGEDSVRTAMQTLGAWARREPGKPITIVLNSPGGRVLDGLALYDFLQRLRAAGHRLRIEVLGRAASMGGVLLQAGDERVIGANAFLLIHEISGGAEGRSSEIGDRIEFFDLMEKRLLDILAARSTMSPRQIRSRWQRKDWWLGAEDAVALGFADAIL